MADIPWPPLEHPPLNERYGVLRPLPPYDIAAIKQGEK